MTDWARNIDRQKEYKISQAYNERIWNIRVKKYLPKWNVRTKLAAYDERVLKVGDRQWLIDESVRRRENKIAGEIDVIPSAGSVIRSISFNTANRAPRRHPVKLMPVFYARLRDRNRAGDIGA